MSRLSSPICLPTNPSLTTEAPTGVTLRASKFRSLDAFRGLAALTVVLCHIAGDYGNYNPHIRRYLLLRLLSNGNLGVEVFFVISGYCVAAAAVSHVEKQSPLRSFFADRIWRIYPAYWLSLVLLITLDVSFHEHIPGLHFMPYLYPEIANGSATPVQIVANALLLQVPLHQRSFSGVSWTLCYEVAFYAICGLAVALFWGKDVRAMFRFFHGLTLGGILVWILAPNCQIFPLDLWPQFGLGVLLLDLWRHPIGKNARNFAVLILFALGLALLREFPLGFAHHDSRKAILTLLSTFAVLMLVRRHDARFADSWFARPLAAVGVFSYSLYLVHQYFVEIVVCLRKDSVSSVRGMLFTGTLALVIALALGWLFFLICEKPQMRWKQRRRLLINVRPSLAEGALTQKSHL